MRRRAIFGAFGILAALVSGCAFEAEESGPARDAEPTSEESAAFDASLFRFSPWVLDDGRGVAGGTQRASALLHFVDTRTSWINPDRWDCRITVSMPIRHRIYGVITPERAAEMSAGVADAASNFVIHSQPKWIAALFCRKFADKMEELFSKALGGSYGARVTSP